MVTFLVEVFDQNRCSKDKTSKQSTKKVVKSAAVFDMQVQTYFFILAKVFS